MLDITTSKDYKPSLNQTLWMQSKASVYNIIILMIIISSSFVNFILIKITVNLVCFS